MLTIAGVKSWLSVTVAMLSLAGAGRLGMAQELIDNGDFSSGMTGWNNESIYFSGSPYPGGVSIVDDAPHAQSLKLSGYEGTNYSLLINRDVFVEGLVGPLQVSFDWKVTVKEPVLGVNFVFFMFYDGDDQVIGKIVYFDTSRPSYHTLEHLRLWGGTAPVDAYVGVQKITEVFDWEHVSVSSDALPGMNAADVRRIYVQLFVQNDSTRGGEMLVDNLSVIDTWLVDCNSNGVHDQFDIAEGTSFDCLGNGVPDECELAGEGCPYLRGDVNNDGDIDEEDVLQFTLVLLNLDECGCSVEAADMNGDGALTVHDVRLFSKTIRCHLGLRGAATVGISAIGDFLEMSREIGVELNLEILLRAREQQLILEPQAMTEGLSSHKHSGRGEVSNPGEAASD